MATISEPIDINRLSLSKVEHVGYSDPSNYLYVRLSGDDYYFVTNNGEKVKKGKVPFEKSLDSSEANDKLDQLISDADDD
ncbi:hypothetical protein ACT4ML_02140 [Natrinema sp. LN54]|uniref:hypothetical protein n=1 Tax=Natrinema sp. LN54 TaxID=3458705 RepID=UPI004035F4D6